MLHRPLPHRRLLLLRHKCFSTVPLSHPVYTIWSANTSLGKTLVSTGLASSFLLSPPPSNPRKFVYLKPLQTGFPSDSDSRSLFQKLSSLSSLRASPLVSSHSVLHSSLPAAKSFAPREYAGVESTQMCELGFREANRSPGNEILKGVSPELVSETFYAWEGALSPHLAVEREGGMVEDSAVVEMVEKRLREELEGTDMEAFCVVESAGGVASPGPSGTLQCDLYRYDAFRLRDFFTDFN